MGASLLGSVVDKWGSSNTISTNHDVEVNNSGVSCTRLTSELFEVFQFKFCSVSAAVRDFASLVEGLGRLVAKDFKFL